MYTIKKLDQLKVGDKAIVLSNSGEFKALPVISLELEQGYFAFSDGDWNTHVSMKEVAVLE